MPPRNQVNLKDVEKGYGSRSVLRDITLGVADGDRIGVVGRNGDGKSTLLRLIAGVEAFRASWSARPPLPEDRLLALRRVATIQSVGASTRIVNRETGASQGSVKADLLIAADGHDPLFHRGESAVALGEVLDANHALHPDGRTGRDGGGGGCRRVS